MLPSTLTAPTASLRLDERPARITEVIARADIDYRVAIIIRYSETEPAYARFNPTWHIEQGWG
jgi:hypothetical protein